MKKLLVVFTIVAAALVFSTNSAFAQGEMSASIGPEISIPMGTWGDAVGFGYGGSGRFDYSLSPNLGLMGTVGYILWGEKDQGGVVKTKGNALKIMAGAKYYFSPGPTKFYGSVELGIYSASITATTTFLGRTYEGTASESKFVIAPGVGVELGSLDLSAFYAINGDIGNIGVRVAYAFGL